MKKISVNSIIKICALLLFIFKFSQSDAQEVSKMYTENIIPASPTQSKFIEYGKMELNEYRGIANIAIPLIKINTRGFEIPLNLSYQSSGNKVKDESEWVGLGWNLNFASINQKVFGKDDLNTIYINRKLKLKYVCCNLFGVHSYDQPDTPRFTNMYINNNDQEWDSDKGYSFIKFEDKSNCNLWDVTNYFEFQNYEMLDTEKDLFVIDLFGVRLYVVLPSELWKNPPFNSSESAPTEIPDFISCKVINKKGYIVSLISKVKWEIIDPRGVKYVFEEKNKVKTTSSSGCFGDDYTVFNDYSYNWQISKIYDIYGDSIIFNYSPKLDQQATFSSINRKIGKFNYRTQGVYYEANGSWLYSDNCGPFKFTPDYVNESFTYRDCSNLTTIYEQKSYLKSIKYNDNLVSFFLSSDRIDRLNSMRLDSIVQLNFNNEMINTTKFIYTYFKSNKTNVNQTENDPRLNRLSLISVENNGEKYSFSYNSTQLPDKESNAVDYWGYYNGKISNQSKLPNLLDFPNVSFDSIYKSDILRTTGVRYADEEFTKACLLEKIVYPTGGYSKLFFSLNHFNNYFAPVKPGNPQNGIYFGNGLKNDSILNYNNENILINGRKIFYENGIQMLPLKPHHNELEQFTEIETGGDLHKKKVENYSCNILNIYSETYYNNWMGNSGVGYGKVTVQNNIGNLLHGQVVHYYANNPDVLPPVDMGELIPIVPSYHKGIENGSLIREDIFDNQNRLTKKTVSSFIVGPNSDIIEYNGKIKNIGYYIDGVNCMTKRVILVSYYPLYVSETFLKSMKTVFYKGNDSIVSNEEYFYDDVFRLNRKEIIVDNNKKIVEKYQFPMDIFNSPLSPSDQASIMNSLITKNRISETIKKDVFVHTNGIEKRLKSNYNEYGPSSLLPEKIKSSLEGYEAKIDMTIKYNENKNVIEKMKYDKLPVAYVWSYNNTFPIAEIKNATYNEVKTALGNDDAIMKEISSNKSPDVNQLRNQLKSKLVNKYRLISTFTYKPLVGLTSVTNPMDVVQRFIYDENGRLSLIRDNNFNILNQIQYQLNSLKISPVNNYTIPDFLNTTIQLNDNVYVGMNSQASVVIPGAVENLEYDWKLTDSSGNLLFSNLQSSSNSFDFICNQTGIFNLNCSVRDLNSGAMYTYAKTITSYNKLSVFFSPYNPTYYLNSVLSIQANVTGANGSYTTKWKVVRDNGVESIVSTNSNSLNYKFIYSGSYVFTFQVTDIVSGQVYSKTAFINVP